MKMAKRIAAAALACAMSLCVFTACGSNSSSSSDLSSDIENAFKTKAGLEVTESKELTSAAKEAAAVIENSEYKTLANNYISALNTGDEDKIEAAYTEWQDYIDDYEDVYDKIYNDDECVDYYMYRIEDGESAEDSIDDAVAKTIEYAKKEGQTITEYGYTVSVDYGYSKDANGNISMKTYDVIVIVYSYTISE